jgi:hypothetical protein
MRVVPVVAGTYDINDGVGQNFPNQGIRTANGFTLAITNVPVNQWVDLNSYTASAEL